MRKFGSSMRPTSAGIVVFGVPALLHAAEQYASGFWRIFCLIGLLGALYLAQAWIKVVETTSADRRPLRRSAAASKPRVEECAAVDRLEDRAEIRVQRRT